MVEGKVIDIVKRYLSALPEYGIRPSKAVLFGSFVCGGADEWSDIDLIVIAPELDGTRTIEQVKQLWVATEAADDRIQPIPCGEREWEEEGGRPILDLSLIHI